MGEEKLDNKGEQERIPFQKKVKRRMRILNSLVVGGLGLWTICVVGNLIDDYKVKKGRKELYQEVRSIANINKDNITDNYEWANVYEFLGLEYDIHYSDPKKDLSLEEMKKYLDYHKN